MHLERDLQAQANRPASAALPPQATELLYPMPNELRSELRLDLRFVLRDPNRACRLPLLAALNRTIEREVARIRFPAEALPRLAAEIDAVTDSLPDKSPLIDLGERARAFARVAALEVAAQQAAGPQSDKPKPDEAHHAAPRSAGEEAQLLRRAAAAVEVSYVTTAELDDTALAGYLNYCMTLENYDAVIGSLLPRLQKAPKVWVWNLLLAAMRLSKAPDFTATAARFHAWMEQRHPEALNHDIDSVDTHRFSTQKLRFLEQKELGLT
jgi:hypothetical protein